LYVFGGFHGPGKGYAFPATTRSDVYDPATDTWSRLKDMPEAFTHTTPAVDGTTIWFVGGYSGNSPGPGSAHVWKYDTLTDTWTRGPDLPAPRGGGASGIVGHILHFFGGADEKRIDRADHWALDLDAPEKGWTARAPLDMPRNHMAAAVAGGRIYAIGGQHGDLDAGVDLRRVDVYEPATDTWSTSGPLPGPRSHTNCCTFVLAGKILVLGGESPDFHREIYQYNPTAGEWKLFGMLPDPRSTAVAGIIDGKIVLATGNSPGETDNVWIGTLE
jgi:N-acetylneuraminic acid mutarotase